MKELSAEEKQKAQFQQEVISPIIHLNEIRVWAWLQFVFKCIESISVVIRLKYRNNLLFSKISLIAFKLYLIAFSNRITQIVVTLLPFRFQLIYNEQTTSGPHCFWLPAMFLSTLLVVFALFKQRFKLWTLKQLNVGMNTSFLQFVLDLLSKSFDCMAA